MTAVLIGAGIYLAVAIPLAVVIGRVIRAGGHAQDDDELAQVHQLHKARRP